MTERSVSTSEPTRLPNTELVGFTPEQVKNVKEQMESTMLPSDNIKTVNYKPIPKGGETILGPWKPFGGEYTLYKSLEKFPLIVQDSTMVHVQAHSSSPFDAKNERFFGSQEGALEAKAHAIAVAEQSKKTRTYLNGFQAKLHRAFEAGKIDDLRFYEETYAIMMELRFNNPKHLNQVERAQKAKLKINEDVVSIRDGIDTTIGKLVPNLKTKEEIERHIENRRKNLIIRGKGILPDLPPLAA